MNEWWKINCDNLGGFVQKDIDGYCLMRKNGQVKAKMLTYAMCFKTDIALTY